MGYWGTFAAMSGLRLSDFAFNRGLKNRARLPRIWLGSRRKAPSSSRMYCELTFRVSSIRKDLSSWNKPHWLCLHTSSSSSSTYLSRNQSLAAVRTLRTSLLARRTSLRSWLLRLSFSCRCQISYLTANALLSSTSVWASPLHPRPSVVRFCCGTSVSAACRVAVANTVSLASMLWLCVPSHRAITSKSAK